MRENACMTRRFLLGSSMVLGASALVTSDVFTSGKVLAHAESARSDASADAGVQYGFLVDLSRCVGCEECVAACRKGNRLSDETPDRRRVSTLISSRRENVYVSMSCMHCGDPSCSAVCPAGAISKGEGGIVSVDKGRCMGCKYCYQACPYEVPRYNEQAMDKCDCCRGSGVPVGDAPHCVRACRFGALRYGVLDELLAQAGEEVRPVAGANDPSCLLV